MRRLILMAMLGGALVAAGCGDDSDSGSGEATAGGANEDVSIGVSIFGHVSPWLDSYGERLTALGKKEGIDVEVLFANGTAQGQDEQVNSLIAQKPDVIALTSLDAESSVATYARIQQGGIKPVAGILPPTEPAVPLISAYRGPDDFEHGKLGAQALGKALEGERGEVGMIRGAPGGTDNKNRAEGFEKELAKVAPDLELAADEDSDWADQKKIYDVATAMLQRNPEIIGLFTQADTLAAAASKAVKDLGLEDQVTIVGVGGSCEGFELVKAGKVYSTSLQDPWVGAKDVFDASVALAKGETPEKIEYMDLPIVTKENVDEYECHW